MSSEVAALMAQIDAEHAAFEHDLAGLALDKARHDFVNASMHRVSERHVEALTYVLERD